MGLECTQNAPRLANKLHNEGPVEFLFNVHKQHKQQKHQCSFRPKLGQIWSGSTRTSRIWPRGPWAARFPGLGSRALVQGLGSKALEPRPWTHCLAGSKALDSGPWTQGLGSKALDPGPWIQGPGSQALDPRPWIQGPRSKALHPLGLIRKVPRLHAQGVYAPVNVHSNYLSTI